MNKNQIENITKVNIEITNFRECYKDSPLWGMSEGPVTAEALIEFLIENPHLQKIADNIEKLGRSVL